CASTEWRYSIGVSARASESVSWPARCRVATTQTHNLRFSRQLPSPNEAFSDRLGDGLLPVGDAELGSDMGKVQFDRALADAEHGRDVAAGVPVRGEKQAPLLLRAQRGTLKPGWQTA